MAAIITEQYRKNSAKTLLADVTNTTASYYIGLGKSDDWYEKLSDGQQAPFPIGSDSDSRGVQHALTDIIRVGAANVKTVIPLVTATSSKFKSYNPYDPTSFYPSTVGANTFKPAYFVDEVSSNVYLFIRSSSTQPLALSNGTNSDTSKITAGENLIITTSGHVIVKIGKVVALSKFNNEQFVEIDLTPNDDDVYCPGYIYGLHVLNGGLYKVGAVAPTGSIRGTAIANGVNASGTSITLSVPFNANVTAGVITSIALNDYESIVTEAYNSTPFADAVIRLTNITIIASSNGPSAGAAVTETTPSVIAPMLSNINGFGQDITKYTPSWYVCFLVNTRSSTHTVYSDYAQVSLLKNPIKADTDTIITAPVVSMTKSFTLATWGGPGATNIKGYQIVQSSGGTITKRIGVVDSYDPITKVVYYNNSLKYGFDTPSTSSPIILVGGTTISTAINPSALTSPDFMPGSADVLFIDNRVSIIRSSDQNEELKIIIQL